MGVTLSSFIDEWSSFIGVGFRFWNTVFVWFFDEEDDTLEP